jgi:hypothetical protein
MYYKLSADMGGAMNVYVKSANNTDCDLCAGELLDADDDDIELPFEFEMKVRRSADGKRTQPRMYAYFPGRELMRKELVKALEDTGVDNLQTFPARITEEGAPGAIEDYLAVNVIGLVASANQKKSRSVPLATGQYFEHLVIDPKRAGKLLLFRLAESLVDVIVHEKVADALTKQEFEGLQLIKLEQG